MRLIAINAKKLTVEEIHAETLLDTAYAHIETSIVDVVRVSHNVDLWIDDNGRVYPPESSLVEDRDGYVHGTLLTFEDGRQLPLAGNLLVSGGVDKDGNTLECSIDEQDFRDFILSATADPNLAANEHGFILTPCYVPML